MHVCAIDEIHVHEVSTLHTTLPVEGKAVHTIAHISLVCGADTDNYVGIYQLLLLHFR